MNLRPFSASKSCITTWTRALYPLAPTAPSHIRCTFEATRSPPLHKSFSKGSSTLYSTEVHPDLQPEPAKLDIKRPRSRRRDRQLDDVVPGDLTATLEAHRESNRRNIIRRVLVGPEEQEEDLVSPGEQEGETLHDALLQDGVAVNDGVADEESNHNNLGTALRKTSRRTKMGPKRRKRMAELAKQRYTLLHAYASGEQSRPWESQESLDKVDRRERLNIEITNFTNWIVPNDEERRFRDILGSYLSHNLEDKVQGVSNFEIYGSQRTGMATAISDIDIKFSVQSLIKREGRSHSVGLNRPQNRKHVESLLIEIKKWLEERKDFDSVQLIDSQLPLLKLRHRLSHLEIQLVFDNDINSVAEEVQAYVTEYPQIKPVYFLINMALHVKSLGDPHFGGLGSYPLLMMIVASFKFARLPRDADHVEALLSFLSFYEALDTETYGISADPPFKFPKRGPFETASLKEKAAVGKSALNDAMRQISVRHETRPWQLCLQNPTDMTQDLGRKCHKYREIKAMISQLADTVRSWLNGDPLLNQAADSPMLVFFGNALGDFADRRSHLQEFVDKEHWRIDKMRTSAFKLMSPYSIKVFPMGETSA